MVVFKIQNKVTQQHYVGSCRSDIFERWELYVRAAEAGLDFPLYREIREHGEAAFAVTELDFAEDIAELKEMELLHTVELCARSLRGYKFGRSDVVVKRCRQADLNNAWMKDLPEPDRPVTAPSARPKVQKTNGAPARVPASSAESAGSAGSAETASAPSVAKPAACSAAPVESERAHPAPPASKTPAATGGELDKALFAEGVGLLVRTLGCFEALDQQRQQADKGAQALSEALTASSQALIELEDKQRLAAERARQAQAAVEASAEANAVLVQAQGQLRASADSLLSLLHEAGRAAEDMGTLQRGVTELLARLKRSGANGEAEGGRDAVQAEEPAAVSAPPVETSKPPAPAGSPAQEVDTEGKDCVLSGNSKKEPGTSAASPVAQSGPAPEVDPAELAAQEARMVNGLKGLDKLLAGAEKARNEPEVLEKPARAWVAADQGAQPPRILEKKSLAATVVHRRSRPNHSRPGRKTLSIRAR